MDFAAERLAEHRRLAEQVLAMRAGIDDIRATGYSRDGAVTAVVGGRGELLDVEVDPRVYRVPDSGALARSILDAVREAGQQAQREAVRLAAGLLPDSDSIDPLFDPALHLLER